KKSSARRSQALHYSWLARYRSCLGTEPAGSAVVLIQGGNKAVDAVLRYLLRELVAVVLDQPDPFHVQIVYFPALRGLFQAVVDAHRRPVALRKRGAHDDVIGIGIAAEWQHGEGRLLIHTGESAAISANKRALECLDQVMLLLFR